MFTLPQWHVFRQRDITAHLRILRGMVSISSTRVLLSYERILWRPVRIWDLLGDEQALKAEYKVLSGRV